MSHKFTDDDRLFDMGYRHATKSAGAVHLKGAETFDITIVMPDAWNEGYRAGMRWKAMKRGDFDEPDSYRSRA